MSLEKTNFYRGVDPLDPPPPPAHTNTPPMLQTHTHELGFVTRIAANVIATQLIARMHTTKHRMSFSVGLHG